MTIDPTREEWLTAREAIRTGTVGTDLTRGQVLSLTTSALGPCPPWRSDEEAAALIDAIKEPATKDVCGHLLDIGHEKERCQLPNRHAGPCLAWCGYGRVRTGSA